MSRSRKILGILWSLPACLVGWVFGILLVLFFQIEKFKVQKDWTFVWDFKEDGWFFKLAMGEHGWVGYSIGNNIFIEDLDDERWIRTLIHENTHCLQWYRWGFLFIFVYVIESLRIYFLEEDKHSYYDNKFEIEARKAAGQTVVIPRTAWKDGPNDRWAWW